MKNKCELCLKEFEGKDEEDLAKKIIIHKLYNHKDKIKIEERR